MMGEFSASFSSRMRDRTDLLIIILILYYNHCRTGADVSISYQLICDVKQTIQ